MERFTEAEGDNTARLTRIAAPVASTAGTTPGVSNAYGWYALAVLVLVYALNFIDRQMLTILAVDIKRDLAISDSQFGFLYGTAFGVFYAVFGIPLGKLADRWSRTGLLALGLATWSAMTMMCGMALNFWQLGVARIGVGVGEATAGPTAYSLLSDYFPPRRRATAVAIFSTGIYLGGGVALSLGTALAGAWNHAFAPGTAPLGLAGWQAAFLAVGAPGLLLALWVRTLREPVRGRFEASPSAAIPPAREAFAAFARDLGSIVPPFTLASAARRGPRALFGNVALLALVAGAVALLSTLLGDPVQWMALGIGVYAVASWVIALRGDDPDAFSEIWGAPAVVGLNVGYGLITMLSYAMSAFGPLYVIQAYGASPAQVALFVGGGAAAGGALGAIFGGMLGDRIAGPGHNARRVLLIMGAATLALIPFGLLLITDSLAILYLTIFPLWFLLSAAIGNGSGTIVNIVPARVRATATASLFLGSTIIGLALGPYMAGRLSIALGSQRLGLGCMALVIPLALIALYISWRDLVRRKV
ncbi:MFS transporter [Novosphingobium sp. FKTRR1]|uniref:MFS transporter n=1 Tax=Novosphingobium sp. FKTRR1 TaxID=2879118 RepID=UPI001CF01BA5|nr:MFS transporter [Novosphingobium sp. FKTRR1]